MTDGFTRTLNGRIASAMAALHGARAAVDHCPSGDNLLIADMAERAVNELLDAKLEARVKREKVRSR